MANASYLALSAQWLRLSLPMVEVFSVLVSQDGARNLFYWLISASTTSQVIRSSCSVHYDRGRWLRHSSSLADPLKKKGEIRNVKLKLKITSTNSNDQQHQTAMFPRTDDRCCFLTTYMPKHKRNLEEKQNKNKKQPSLFAKRSTCLVDICLREQQNGCNEEEAIGSELIQWWTTTG